MYSFWFPFEGRLPHLTTQFFPTKILEEDYSIQKFIFGEQRQIDSPKTKPHLLIGKLELYSDKGEESREDYISSSKLSKIRQMKNHLHVEVSICHEGDVNKARYCPHKNSLIASKTNHGDVLLFDYQRLPSHPSKKYICTPLVRLQGHKPSEGFGLSWNSHHEGMLISSSYDDIICLWDVGTGGLRGTLQAHAIFSQHSNLIEDVMWMPYHKTLFGSVGWSGMMTITDVRQKERDKGQFFHIGKANSLSFNPYFDFFMAAALFNGSISILDMRQLRGPVITLRGHKGPCKQVMFSPHNKEFLASSGEDGNVCLWNLKSQSHGRDLSNPLTEQPDLCFIHNRQDSIHDFDWSSVDINTFITAGHHHSSVWKPIL